MNDFKSFENTRPITKTSPIYKLLDTILNTKLNKELKRNNQLLLDRG